MRAISLMLTALYLVGCTIHVCGDTEVAHQTGDGEISETHQSKDEAKADVKATLPIK